MNFNDPDKTNDEMSLNEDDGQHNNIGNEQDDILMDTTDMDDSTEADLDDVTDEADPEYSSLDKQLDDLNSVLDILEQKNDHIQSQLRVLLENSREIRQNIVKESETDTSDLGSTD
ncbi:hypothetical protein DAPPUDRAFT_254525 [Daphnia pulex]|uniref:Uncharacterized protein n=1 Tax=Daphnia pulex TaxID=6669 RepID=E9H787_DAPPU|nr:hypothetical protein DAPPUDRAFT_254525 [Daphnia pulex]|eukprot:EFX72412.1 hypothetical protein DAPPUDRAFT_254525 [Daphnia pulex]